MENILGICYIPFSSKLHDVKEVVLFISTC